MREEAFTACRVTRWLDVKGKDKYVDNDRYKEKFPDGDFRPKACSKLGEHENEWGEHEQKRKGAEEQAMTCIAGFMTSDFAKRELYANTRNTERLRETLRKEDRLMKKVRQVRRDASEVVSSSS